MLSRTETDVRAVDPADAPRQPARASRCDEVAGAVRLVPIERLQTHYERLRPGVARGAPQPGPEFPLLVALRADGDYEVLDGIKRLGRWRERGHRLAPVLVEPPGSSAEHKRRLLAANTPARTSTALDEARVVCSLADEELLGPSAIGRLLGHKRQWVERRIALGRRLSRRAQDELGRGVIGPTLGHELSRLAHEEQDRVLGAIARHQLGQRDALALVHAWRTADETDRRELLREPLGLLRPDAAQSRTLSPRARDIEAELERLGAALQELALFTLPEDLPPPERRRLEALWRGVLAELAVTAVRLGAVRAMPAADPIAPQEPCRDETDETAQPQSPRPSNGPQSSEDPFGGHRPSGVDRACGDSRGASGEQQHQQHQQQTQGGVDRTAPAPEQPRRDHRADAHGDRAASSALWLPGDRPAGGSVAQGRDPRIAADGAINRAPMLRSAEQARAIPRGDSAPGGQEADDDPYPAGDPSARVRRGAHDSRQVRARASIAARAEADSCGQAPLRDRPG